MHATLHACLTPSDVWYAWARANIAVNDQKTMIDGGDRLSIIVRGKLTQLICRYTHADLKLIAWIGIQRSKRELKLQ